MLSARNSVGFVSASEAVAKAVASEYNKMHSVAYQRTASFLVGSDEIHVIVKLLLSETSQQPSRTKTLPRVVVDGACGDSAQRPSFRLPSSNTPTSPLALSLPPRHVVFGHLKSTKQCNQSIFLSTTKNWFGTFAKLRAL